MGELLARQIGFFTFSLTTPSPFLLHRHNLQRVLTIRLWTYRVTPRQIRVCLYYSTHRTQLMLWGAHFPACMSESGCTLVPFVFHHPCPIRKRSFTSPEIWNVAWKLLRATAFDIALHTEPRETADVWISRWLHNCTPRTCFYHSNHQIQLTLWVDSLTGSSANHSSSLGLSFGTV